jgi:SAM-dependent methyltransferase
MRNCPVCEYPERDLIFPMTYRVPDGWTVPNQIDWYTCGRCGTIYGDGAFNQSDLDTYYRERYGYGINSPANIQRLKSDAAMISRECYKGETVVDFGGAGDDGKSVLVEFCNQIADAYPETHKINAVCIGVGDALPAECDVIYASHVIEHVYDLPETMQIISAALKPDGLLIIDVPDATGLLQQWKMPILDFNTKHVNHFTLRTLLELGHHHGFELVHLKPYELEGAPAYQVHFKRLDVAYLSAWHITTNIGRRIERLKQIHEPVNVWGLGDITWHILSQVELDVLDYIDNDPAYRQATYSGKPVQERPTNDSPIVILAQGQRGRLIVNIKKICSNPIVEI